MPSNSPGDGDEQESGTQLLTAQRMTTGIVVWLVIVAVVVLITGFGPFLDTAAKISLFELTLLLSIIAVNVTALGISLYVIVRHLGFETALGETILLDTSVNLAHNLTPFGQAGGAPIGAVVLASRSGARFETCLAAISMKDAITFVPAILIFTIGGPYFALAGLPQSHRLQLLFVLLALFVIVVTTVVLAVRRYPERTRRMIQDLVMGVNRTLRRLPAVPACDDSTLEGRVQQFSATIARVTGHRRTLVLASAFATVAFLAQGVLLWLALRAVGADIPLALAIFVVPLSLLASALPLPGGSGGVEAVQVIVIEAMTGAPTTATITAVVLSRGMVYWTPIVLGSMTLVGFQMDEGFGSDR